jgi:hypothetical protein
MAGPDRADEPQFGSLVRAAHADHVASLTDADLCSTLVDDQDTRDTWPAWPASLWGGTHTATHSSPLPDDLNPEDIVGWIA